MGMAGWMKIMITVDVAAAVVLIAVEVLLIKGYSKKKRAI